MRERVVEKHLTDGLKKIGVPCVKFIPDLLRGMPDRIIMLPDGRVIWCELKTTGGKLEPIQEVRHRDLRRAGQRVEVVWSTAEADSLIDEIKRTYSLE